MTLTRLHGRKRMLSNESKNQLKMKRPLTIVLLMLAVLSTAYAFYKYREVDGCRHKAARVEITLNEKIRILQDSLTHAYNELEIEKRNLLEVRKMAESMAIEMEKLRNK